MHHSTNRGSIWFLVFSHSGGKINCTCWKKTFVLFRNGFEEFISSLRVRREMRDVGVFSFTALDSHSRAVVLPIKEHLNPWLEFDIDWLYQWLSLSSCLI